MNFMIASAPYSASGSADYAVRCTRLPLASHFGILLRSGSPGQLCLKLFTDRRTSLLTGASSQSGTREREKAWSVRRHAVEQLLRIEEEGGFVGRVASSGGRQPFLLVLSPDERRKVTEYVAQVTRLKRRLDWRISQLTRKPIAQMEPRLLQVLRLGIYEIFEDNLPEYVISAHVDLAKTTVGGWSKGFVNAVLREACRRRLAKDLMLPERPRRSAALQEWEEALATVYSHPTWMVAGWLKRFGLNATEQLLQANNRVPTYGLRINSLRHAQPDNVLDELIRLGVDAMPSRWLPKEFVAVKSLQPVLQQGLVQQGNCMVQDEAAGLVVAMLDPQPGEAVLDACAAPGSKTLFTAARMKNQGHLVAMDVYPNRLRPLARAADTCGVGPMLQILPGGLGSLTASRLACGESWSEGKDLVTEGFREGFYDDSDLDWTSHEPSESSETGELPQFDRVLLDVPCSGLGVLSKRADLRWRRQPEDMQDLLALQRELLEKGSSFVKPGGYLVYSTCSIEPDENQEQIRAFLRRKSNFELADPPVNLPQEVIQGSFLLTLPHVHGIDGAFAARLKKVPDTVSGM